MPKSDPQRGDGFRFCHVLTSGGADPFCEMTYISVALLKRLYPGCHATVLADDASARELAAKPYRFDDMPGPLRLQVEDIDPALRGNAVRSRYLKTRMRELVDGDFVFLDADALPLKRFDELFSGGADFAAALDRNREFPEPKFPDWVIPTYDHFGWPHPLPNYYNSGVMFLADNAAMRAMAAIWHARWREVYDAFGIYQDQPTLNHTLHELGISQRRLPLKFNAMVDASPYFSRGARIVHYFLRGERREADPLSLLTHLVDHLRRSGEIDWPAVESAARRSDAWVHPTGSVHIELATGHYLRALGIAASRSLQRLAPSNA